MSYTAVNLNQESRQRLLSRVFVPDGWRVIAHHCTLHLGEHRDGDLPLGTPVELSADAVAINGRVLAVRVSGARSENPTPHVTIAVSGEAKPVESNKLTKWMEIPTIKLQGEVAQND